MMGRLASVTAVALGLLLGSVGVAQADDRSFLDYIHASGVPSEYPLGAGDASNLMAGDMICRMLRTGHSAAELPFLGFAQEQFKPQLVDGAQRELCPDTLGAA